MPSTGGRASIFIADASSSRNRNTGTPNSAVSTPTGSWIGATTVRAAVSAAVAAPRRPGWRQAAAGAGRCRWRGAPDAARSARRNPPNHGGDRHPVSSAPSPYTSARRRPTRTPRARAVISPRASREFRAKGSGQRIPGPARPAPATAWLTLLASPISQNSMPLTRPSGRRLRSAPPPRRSRRPR